MKNYILQIEYFGENYNGWQRQTSFPSVQSEVEKALSKVANHKVEVVCAGRTDSGVHATSQIANFLSNADRSLMAWKRGLNAILPNDIKIINIQEVPNDFNSRFAAISRTYNYVIYNAQVSSPIFARHSLWENRALDIDKMNQAAKYLLGKQDFTSFRSSQCQANTPFRTIQKAEFTKHGSFIIFEVQGNAFLHHMIRNLVGSLVNIGLGQKPPEWIKELLDAKDRTIAAKTARPQGLYFVGVEYENFEYIRPMKDIFVG
ncbi:tRNA pseudouridine(38-40) synthase TruA [Francisellaceae bacterium CB300]|jgi:tRNA pseudouridine38-40 synthase